LVFPKIAKLGFRKRKEKQVEEQACVPNHHKTNQIARTRTRRRRGRGKSYPPARKSGLGLGVFLLPLAQGTKERGWMVGREPNNAAATARWSGEGWNEARAGSVRSANCKGAFFSSFLHGLSRIFSSLFFFSKFNSAPGTHASSTKKSNFKISKKIKIF
jgi:hypothetical protein